MRKPGFVQVLLKHQDLIVRRPEEIKQEQKHAGRAGDAEKDRAQPSSEQQVMSQGTNLLMLVCLPDVVELRSCTTIQVCYNSLLPCKPNLRSSKTCTD